MSEERWVFTVNGEDVPVVGPAENRGLVWWIEKVSQIEAAREHRSELTAVEDQSFHMIGERDSAPSGAELSKEDFDAFAARDKQRREK